MGLSLTTADVCLRIDINCKEPSRPCYRSVLASFVAMPGAPSSVVAPSSKGQDLASSRALRSCSFRPFSFDFQTLLGWKRHRKQVGGHC